LMDVEAVVLEEDELVEDEVVEDEVVEDEVVEDEVVEVVLEGSSASPISSQG
jgi:hypothetical protein